MSAHATLIMLHVGGVTLSDISISNKYLQTGWVGHGTLIVLMNMTGLPAAHFQIVASIHDGKCEEMPNIHDGSGVVETFATETLMSMTTFTTAK